MAASGATIGDMLVAVAQQKADMLLKTSGLQRQLYEAYDYNARQRIQRDNEIREQKKAERKARKRRNATWAATAVAALVTGGLGAALAPAGGAAAAGGALTATGQTLAATGLPQLTAAGAGLIGQGAAVSALAPSFGTMFLSGGLQALGTSFGLQGVTQLGNTLYPGSNRNNTLRSYY